MFHHVVSFRFKPAVSAADVDRLAEDLTAFAASLDGLVSYACGTDLRLREGNDDFAVAAVFDTEEALLGYLTHPRHLDIVARHVTSLVEHKHSAQFAVR
jgi:hypothetical protein